MQIMSESPIRDPVTLKLKTGWKRRENLYILKFFNIPVYIDTSANEDNSFRNHIR